PGGHAALSAVTGSTLHGGALELLDSPPELSSGPGYRRPTRARSANGLCQQSVHERAQALFVVVAGRHSLPKFVADGDQLWMGRRVEVAERGEPEILRSARGAGAHHDLADREVPQRAEHP